MPFLALSAALLFSGDSIEPLFPGTGSHSRKVAARAVKAQQYFDQGLKLLYGFNQDEARRSFQEAAKLDPQCAMAWWGVAMSDGPHVNNSFVPQANADEALKALSMAHKGAASAIDKELLAATDKRFSKNQLAEQSKLDQAYAGAMKAVWARHPKDADVGALYAEALMDLQPWDYWTNDGKPKGGTAEFTKVIGKVLVLNPNHPMALHLAIHAWEASPTPERALAAANRLRFLQPALGHMVHMPSHTYVRTGDWQEAIAANERAIAADEAYRKVRPKQGFYRIYMAHNRHMLGYAAMMVGQSQKCIDMFDSMVKAVPEDFVKENAGSVDGMIAMPLEARVRFGRWDEVLATAEYPDYLPMSRAFRHAARGVAFAAKGEPESAIAEQTLFLEARKKLAEHAGLGNNGGQDLLNIAEHHLAAEVLLAQDKTAEAIAELEKAVQAEDQLRYDEPPDWILPTRHVLGVALLKAGRYAEAETVYRADLKKLPRNGWSLYGLSEALRLQGQLEAGEMVRRDFEKVWATADMQITSSCMCVPKP